MVALRLHKRLHQVGLSSQLSDVKNKVLFLYKFRNLKIKDIAIRLRMSRQAVEKHIKSLRDDALIFPNENIGGGGLRGGVASSENNPIRLHALQLRCKVYYTTDIYKPNYIYEFGDFSVHTRGKTLHIFIKKEFQGAVQAECENSAFLFILGMLSELERLIGAYIVKNNHGIEVVKSHYAYEGHPVAKYINQKFGGSFVFRSEDDGKARIVVDSSKGIPELEAVHSGSAAEDFENFVSFFGDLAKNPDFKISDLKEFIVFQTKFNISIDQKIGALADSMRVVIEILKSMLPPPPEVGDELPKGEKPDYFG